MADTNCDNNNCDNNNCNNNNCDITKHYFENSQFDCHTCVKLTKAEITEKMTNGLDLLSMMDSGPGANGIYGKKTCNSCGAKLISKFNFTAHHPQCKYIHYCPHGQIKGWDFI